MPDRLLRTMILATLGVAAASTLAAAAADAAHREERAYVCAARLAAGEIPASSPAMRPAYA